MTGCPLERSHLVSPKVVSFMILLKPLDLIVDTSCIVDVEYGEIEIPKDGQHRNIEMGRRARFRPIRDRRAVATAST